MSSMDLYEDGFPHGTKEGYERGCRSGACPNAFEGETICRDAFLRYQGDYAYRRAVDAGKTPPPAVLLSAPPAKGADARVFPAPTVTVDDSVEPEPAEVVEAMDVDAQDEGGFEVFDEGPRRRGRPPRMDVVHPSKTMYQRGCRKDNECPSFLADGRSCRQVALEHKRELARAKREQREAAASQFDRIPVEVVGEPSTVETAPAAVAPPEPREVETTVTRLPSGGVTIVIRIPASVVAA